MAQQPRNGGITAPNVTVKEDPNAVIEPLVTTEFSREIAEEAFMNEPVIVQIAPTTDENAVQIPIISVNGINQPIERGVPTTIKRKFLEVLARMKETRYTQRQDPRELDRIEMIPRTGLVYPFELLEDKNPKGRAWLNHVLQEA